jgi:hypothetical protein
VDCGTPVNFESSSCDNGAGLMTVGSFPDPTIFGSFEFTGDNDDRFSIILGFDGTSFDPHWQDPDSGIQIQFSPSSNPSDISSLQINDPPNPGTDASILAYANPQINTDTFYYFEITDFGGLINVYMGGSTNPIASVTDDNNYGNEIGIFNRSQIDVGGPQMQTEVDYISITSVPEPSSLPIFGISLFGIYLKKKNQ